MEYDLRGGCCNSSSSGSDMSYTESFSSVTSIVILGSTHNIGRMPAVAIYETGGDEIESDINVNESTFDVTITFNIAVSGTILLT